MDSILDKFNKLQDGEHRNFPRSSLYSEFLHKNSFLYSFEL